MTTLTVLDRVLESTFTASEVVVALNLTGRDAERVTNYPSGTRFDLRESTITDRIGLYPVGGETRLLIMRDADIIALHGVIEATSTNFIGEPLDI